MYRERYYEKFTSLSFIIPTTHIRPIEIPYIQQKFPLDEYGTYYTTGVATPTYVARSGGSLETKTKKSKDSSYPTAVIRAKSKDNDRLIKQILEVIKNHKDLAKGVRMTDYSKYIIKD